MGNGAQHGVAVAAAASLCNGLEITPRQLHDERLDELKALVERLPEAQIEALVRGNAARIYNIDW